MYSHATVDEMQNWKHLIYKYIVSISGHPDKAYLETAEGDFKQRYYKHISSFKNKAKMNKTNLAKKWKWNEMVYRQICTISF